jgi:Fur family ferric uptake transcriptional regulator
MGPRSSRSTESSVDAVKACIRQAGLRCTPARVAVMQHLDHVPGPRTHAEVAESLADHGFDRATIYRNLIELTEAKLVNRVELGDHVWRFERKRPSGRSAGRAEDHPHFVCTACGEVSCLDDVNVAITPKQPAIGRGGKAGAKTGGKSGGKHAGAAAARTHRGIREVTEVLLKGRCEGCG